MDYKAIKNHVPFIIHAGARLCATSSFQLFVPATILDPPGTPISDLIILSNEDAEIGLFEKDSTPGKVSAIVVNMNPGDEISLGRSSEVIVDGLKASDTAFEPL